MISCMAEETEIHGKVCNGWTSVISMIFWRRREFEKPITLYSVEEIPDIFEVWWFLEYVDLYTMSQLNSCERHWNSTHVTWWCFISMYMKVRRFSGTFFRCGRHHIWSASELPRVCPCLCCLIIWARICTGLIFYAFHLPFIKDSSCEEVALIERVFFRDFQRFEMEQAPNYILAKILT